MHAIADNALIGTWPSPVTAEQAARLPASAPPQPHYPRHHYPPDRSAPNAASTPAAAS
jgi:hypothetical protein